jgi:hypothetical protein
MNVSCFYHFMNASNFHHFMNVSCFHNFMSVCCFHNFVNVSCFHHFINVSCFHQPNRFAIIPRVDTSLSIRISFPSGVNLEVLSHWRNRWLKSYAACDLLVCNCPITFCKTSPADATETCGCLFFP